MLSEKLVLRPGRGARAAIATAVLAVCVWFGAAAGAQAAAPIGAFTTKGAFAFVSAPGLHPPKIRTDTATDTGKLAPGDFLVANLKDLTKTTTPLVGEGGPLILDSHLQPIWFEPIGVNAVATDLRAQTYEGKPVLSWWQGVINSSGVTQSGEDVVVDQHYRRVATLTGKDGWVISEHEIVISGHDAWVTSYKNVPMDLTPYGGAANGVLSDAAVQEYDLRTGRLLSTWDALAHIPLTASETRPPPIPSVPWDAYHVNSVQLIGSGSFVVSFRNTWAGYLVTINTGAIQWVLGGKDSTFTFGPNAQFQWQHDVELHPGGVVSIFDDHCCAILGPAKFAPPTGPSRGLVLKLDTTNHVASLRAQYSRGSTFNAAFLGDTQLQPDGNVLVGWGSQPVFSEYSASGKLLLDAVLPHPDLTYRVYLSNWVGLPSFPPNGAVRNQRGKSTVYASWNGDTQVVAWKVLAGPNAKHLTSVATRAKRGFETSIRLNTSYKVFKVQALDTNGHVLRTSRAFSVPTPALSTPRTAR
jgi:hypothetical protein